MAAHWRVTPPYWRIVIVGEVSGARTPIDFLTFHRIDLAVTWIMEQERKRPSILTRYVVEEVEPE